MPPEQTLPTGRPQEPEPLAATIQVALEHLEEEQFDEAILACERALGAEKACAEALHVLGLVNFELDEPRTAIRLIEAAHQLSPDVQEYAEALAAIYARLGDVRNSLYYAKLGTTLAPHPTVSGLLPGRFGSFFYNLERGRSDLYLDRARSNHALGQYREALRECEAHLDLVPGDAEALRLIAECCREIGETERAITAGKAVIHGAQAAPEDFSHLARALARAGRHGDAAECHRLAAEAAPHDARLGSAALADLLRNPATSRAEIDAAHLRWQARHAAGIERRPPCPDLEADPDKRLRIGYISHCFRYSDVMELVEPVLRQHRRERFEIYCYHDGALSDGLTERLARHADRWIDSYRIDDETLWQIMRGDRIDIAVDLSGQGCHGRALMLARGPAPVSVSWLGAAHPPGLSQLDYFLSDAVAWPEDSPRPATGEAVWRLPRGLSCIVPTTLAPIVTPLPALSSEHLTFGVQADLSRIGLGTARLWTRVLKDCGRPARLLICNSLDLDRAAIERCLEHFALCGARHLVDIVNKVENFETELELYDHVDIALDPPGCNALTETQRALFMGVPVIALAGDRHGARLGASLLASAGLAEWAGHSEAELVAIAGRLAGSLPALARLRAELRERFVASPLCNAAGFTAALEQAYREMWQIWCRGWRDRQRQCGRP